MHNHNNFRHNISKSDCITIAITQLGQTVFYPLLTLSAHVGTILCDNNIIIIVIYMTGTRTSLFILFCFYNKLLCLDQCLHDNEPTPTAQH